MFLPLVMFFVFFPSPSFTRGHRLGPGDDEMYQRTTVSIMQKEQDRGILIQSYSPTGFNIDGNRVFGPCALLPPAILQWNVRLLSENSYLLFSFGIVIFKSVSPCRSVPSKTSQKKVFLCSTCLNQE